MRSTRGGLAFFSHRAKVAGMCPAPFPELSNLPLSIIWAVLLSISRRSLPLMGEDIVVDAGGGGILVGG